MDYSISLTFPCSKQNTCSSLTAIGEEGWSLWRKGLIKKRQMERSSKYFDTITTYHSTGSPLLPGSRYFVQCATWITSFLPLEITGSLWMSPQVPEGGTALYYISQGSITQWDPVAWEHTRDPKSAEKTQINSPLDSDMEDSRVNMIRLKNSLSNQYFQKVKSFLEPSWHYSWLCRFCSLDEPRPPGSCQTLGCFHGLDPSDFWKQLQFSSLAWPKPALATT